MAGPIVLVADAGREAGLGHVSRSTAVAVALRILGLDTRCYIDGEKQALRRDGITWTPLRSSHLPAAHVLLIDSYRLPQEALNTVGDDARLVLMHDFGETPQGAALVVSPAEAPSGDGSRLSGFAYAPLRRGFWGLPPREVGPSVERVLVTTGGGQFASLGKEVGHAVAAKVPESKVTVVAGPHGSIESSPEIELLQAPDSLLGALLAADVVVTAAGQTMLEAAAAGTPCVALPLVENQYRQALRLAEAGAIRVVDPPSAAGAAEAVAELAADTAERHALSRQAQIAVDGYGALRVAFAIARLARGTP